MRGLPPTLDKHVHIAKAAGNYSPGKVFVGKIIYVFAGLIGGGFPPSNIIHLLSDIGVWNRLPRQVLIGALEELHSVRGIVDTVAFIIVNEKVVVSRDVQGF